MLRQASFIHLQCEHSSITTKHSHLLCNSCEIRLKYSTTHDQHCSGLYWCNRVQTGGEHTPNAELNWTLQRGNPGRQQTEWEQAEIPATEGRLGYWGPEELVKRRLCDWFQLGGIVPPMNLEVRL